jgi:hypothetical protein
MQWQVTLHPRAQKALAKLPERVQFMFGVLVKEMRISGPVRGDWANYGKLGKTAITAISRKAVRPMWLFGKKWTALFNSSR